MISVACIGCNSCDEYYREVATDDLGTITYLAQEFEYHWTTAHPGGASMHVEVEVKDHYPDTSFWVRDAYTDPLEKKGKTVTFLKGRINEPY